MHAASSRPAENCRAPDAAPESVVLSVAELCKSYAEVVAVDRVSFAVRRNEIVGLLGPNGAGKTTTLNMILGVLSPTSGSIRIAAIDIAKHRSRALAHTNFAAVYAALPGNLTVSQNLRFFGLIYAIGGLAERLEALLEEFDLRHLRDTKCGVLSSGEQTRRGTGRNGPFGTIPSPAGMTRHRLPSGRTILRFERGYKDDDSTFGHRAGRAGVCDTCARSRRQRRQEHVPPTMRALP